MTGLGRLVRPMVARDPDEHHRAATPLELFFDLVFVIAIAQAATGLHHGLSEAHIAESALNFFLVFFAIWWAWTGFTWFGSAYDNDDVPYRLAVFLQLAGALVLAAGVSRAFAERDYRVVLVGFIIMRIAMVIQRLRSARSDPTRRRGAYRHAGTLVALQLAWVGLILAPRSWLVPGILAIGTLELFAVLWSERAAPTTWHRGHIAERYGLLMIIVLGEALLSSALALEALFGTAAIDLAVMPTLLGGLLAVFAMWWIYFDHPVESLLTDDRVAFGWAYGHLVLYAAAAAVGAGIAVGMDHVTHHSSLTDVAAGLVTAVPAAVYVLAVWAVHERRHASSTGSHLPFGALVVLGMAWTPEPVLGVGLVLAGIVGVRLLRRGLAPAPSLAA